MYLFLILISFPGTHTFRRFPVLFPKKASFPPSGFNPEPGPFPASGVVFPGFTTIPEYEAELLL